MQRAELSSRIIGAAIEVHRKLGPGFLESVYENALMIEMPRHGLMAQRQVECVVLYDGIEVGKHRLDLVVEGSFVVELKR